MKTPMTEVCGCVNERDDETELVRCVSKCQFHRDCHTKNEGDAVAYYEQLGMVVDGIPQCRRLERELVNSGVPLDYAIGKFEQALEIGCGFSPYVPLMHKLGYNYLGIDSRPLACEWTGSTHCCHTICASLENFVYVAESFALVLAMHVLEHVEDAPAMIKKIHHLLFKGGKVILIVPNGYDDPTNPDHLWFFTETSISRLLTSTGFSCVYTSQRRVVKHERFIYVSAVKG